NEFKFGNPVVSPLAIFDITGSLTARLFAFLKINLFLFKLDKKWDITPPVELLKFDFPFVRVPTLATELGDGVLQLNMGKFAGQRLEGDTSDGDETFVIKQGGDADHVKVWSTLVDFNHNGMYDDAEAQEYRATSLILGLGGQGNDVIDASGVTSNVKFEFEGNAGDDVIKAGSGTGAAKILGGAGNDKLWGGGGDDLIFGEAGDDEIHGGGGKDWLFGDGSVKDSIHDNTITVKVKANDGADSVYGDGGDDLLFGAGGADVLEGGDNDDVLVADAGKVTVDGDRHVTNVEDTNKDKKGGNDVLRGNAGNDRMYGGFGNDILEGGDNDDLIFGEMGLDTIDGGGGEDLIYGATETHRIDER